MRKKEYDELQRAIFRNLKWETKGAFPYWNEKDVDEARLKMLKQLAKYKPKATKTNEVKDAENN